jgi:hypothetical protein
MILGMPARRLAAAAPAIEAAWATSPSVNASLSESNRRLEVAGSGSGSYANVVSDVCVADLGYYSAHLESNNESVGVGFTYYLTNFDASNAARWIGDSGAGDTSVGGWIDSGTSYRNGVALNNFGATTSGDYQFAVRRSGSTWRIWIRLDGGFWSGVTPGIGSPDPETDTNPSYIFNDTSETRLQMAASIFRSGATSARFVRLHGNAAETTGTVPTGFTAAKFVLP